MSLSDLFRAYQAAPSPQTALPLGEHLGPATAGAAQKLHELLVAHRSAFVADLTERALHLQERLGMEHPDAVAFARVAEVLFGEAE